MKRIATVDIGTNTALLLVADVGEREVESIYEEDRYVRLGQGVDAHRRLAPDAIERVMEALRVYKSRAEEYGAETVVIGATSASRDAQNLADLQARVRDELGLDYGLISGDEEALWSFRGACAAISDLDAACVLDIGGGSTEIIAGPTDGDPERVSVDVGSVRLTERYFSALPPSDSETDAAERFVSEAFDGVTVGAGLPLFGASGTTRALGKLVHPDAPLAPIDAATVRDWRDRLLELTAEETLALDPIVLRGRADVYAAGLLILSAFLTRFGFESITPSAWGLRHGLALRWVAEHVRSV